MNSLKLSTNTYKSAQESVQFTLHYMDVIYTTIQTAIQNLFHNIILY